MENLFDTSSRSQIEAFTQGGFLCHTCHAQVATDGVPALDVVVCPSCNSSGIVPKKIGKFWLYYPISGGDRAAVYRAFNEDFPYHQFAVKVLPRDRRDDGELIEKLEYEADILYSLESHPCILSGIEYGSDNDEYYLATEYYGGERVAKILDERGPFKEVEVIIAGLRMLSAATHIYNHGFLYRNFKPENIILSRSRGLCFYDFSLALPRDIAAEKSDEKPIGSKFHVSFEQFTGDPEDVPSEIFNIGMVLYNMLTAATYYTENELRKLKSRLRGEETLTLSVDKDKMKNIRPALAEVLRVMVKRKPESRYQSFFDVERDLIRILERKLKPADL